MIIVMMYRRGCGYRLIAELRCLEDEREILKRQNFIRTHPVYHTNVLIKSSKSHMEQVLDSNFNVLLKEVTMTLHNI